MILCEKHTNKPKARMGSQKRRGEGMGQDRTKQIELTQDQIGPTRLPPQDVHILKRRENDPDVGVRRADLGRFILGAHERRVLEIRMRPRKLI
jgi:hypothetical protein